MSKENFIAIQQDRRGFLASLAAALVLDPERALWVPGRKLISIPQPPPDPLSVSVSFTTRMIDDPAICLEQATLFLVRRWQFLEQCHGRTHVPISLPLPSYSSVYCRTIQMGRFPIRMSRGFDAARDRMITRLDIASADPARPAAFAARAL